MSLTHLAAALSMVTIWVKGLRPGPFWGVRANPFHFGAMAG